jgi:hypothetical protein
LLPRRVQRARASGLSTARGGVAGALGGGVRGATASAVLLYHQRTSSIHSSHSGLSASMAPPRGRERARGSARRSASCIENFASLNLRFVVESASDDA